MSQSEAKTKSKSKTPEPIELFTQNVTTNVSGGGFKDDVGGFKDVVAPVVKSSGNAGSYSDTISRQVTTQGFYSSDEESSDDEVEVLVKLLQQKDNGSVLLDQQTVLITSQDTNEAIFNFAAVATNADKLTIEVSRRLPLISLESKTTTRLCF